MSFVPSNANLYADPLSPVPSYQASSHSGSVTSPGRSIASSTTAPSWASPQSPSSNSCTSNAGEAQVPVYVKEKQQQTQQQRVSKSEFDIVREKQSKARALNLLDSMTAADTKSAGVHHLKTPRDTFREKGASIRALQLLNETSGADVASTFRPEATAPDAAVTHHDTGRELPSFVNCRHQEHLAESTRPKRPLTAEDVRDPETVAGMKCQMDIEREERAKKKALWLMRYGCFA